MCLYKKSALFDSGFFFVQLTAVEYVKDIRLCKVKEIQPWKGVVSRHSEHSMVFVEKPHQCE